MSSETELHVFSFGTIAPSKEDKTTKSMMLNIFGEKYKVIFSKEEFIKHCEENDFSSKHILGVCDYYGKAIYINPEQDLRSMLHTVIHECLHAIGDVTGHRQLSESTPKNEAFIDVLATGVVQLLEQSDFTNLVSELLNNTNTR